MRNIIKDGVELLANVVGFLKGYAYNVEIIKVFDNDLNLTVIFGIEIPALEERNKKREPADINHKYPLCLGPDGVYLRRCLGDLNMAIQHLDDTAFYCFRALESLKQYFGYILEISGDREQWEEMSKAIGGNREDIEPIRKLAFPARHGVPEPITDKKRKEVFLITWDIVEKFMDYRLKQYGSDFRLHPIP
ncbi:MAG: hypothetical protein HY578_08775 [Nitrospinae bacterium]|nr:hypothetical protein [Nitrospinota bacterium]